LAGRKFKFKTENFKFLEKELFGKQVTILLNLEPKKFFNEEGQGILLVPKKKVVNGTKIC